MNATTNLLFAVRSIFDRPDRSIAALATSLAGELRALPELPQQVLALARASRRERAAMLLRTAQNFRGQWETLGAADALKRIAGKPALFDAVTRELCAAA